MRKKTFRGLKKISGHRCLFRKGLDKGTRGSFPEDNNIGVSLQLGVELVGGEAAPHADLVGVVATVAPAVEAVPPRLTSVHRVLVHTPQHTYI